MKVEYITQEDRTNLITQYEADGYALVSDMNVTDGNFLVFEVKPTEAEKLENAQKQKLTELYNAYQTEKWSEITSNVTGSDGLFIVFEYAKENKEDYQAIATAFAIDPNKTESIIGSKSHGKFYITREQMITLAADMDNHETNLYLKFKDKEALVSEAKSEVDVRAVIW